MEKRYKILIVDDEKEAREIFSRLLQSEYDIKAVSSPYSAMELLERESFDIILSDVVMPDMDGIEFLKKLKKRWNSIPVIMISGKASVKMSVEAMKIGAEDFIEKPVEDLDLLKIIINKTIKNQQQNNELKRLKKIVQEDYERRNLVGNSAKIQKILQKAQKIAPLDITVLITGETGVGKEVLANYIWRNSSRKDKKFVAVNCGSLPETLLESALFGHKKGAFTDAISDKIGYFEEADKGTLFLDEITETTPSFQIKLLRVIETGTLRRIGDNKDRKVDVRIIAATNKKIEEEVKAGRFRQDLFYRLNVITIEIPPLRERAEDIIILANSFLKEYSEKYKKPDLRLSKEVMNLLMKYQWTGNIRELRNAMEHAVAMSSGNIILPQDLPENIFSSQSEYDKNISYLFSLPYHEAKGRFEKKYIEELLTKTNGDVTLAAEISGIKRQNLYDKFHKYNINPRNFKKK
jgi:DNA-binding NtrC family response regulator